MLGRCCAIRLEDFWRCSGGVEELIRTRRGSHPHEWTKIFVKKSIKKAPDGKHPRLIREFTTISRKRL